MVRRGDIWWTELEELVGSEPGYRRPVLIIQADEFNMSRINTVIAVILTSNLTLADAPGNLLLLRHKTGLNKDAVVNVSQILTINKQDLTERIGNVSDAVVREVGLGLRLVLAL